MSISLKKEKDLLESAGTKLLSLALSGGASEAEICGRYRQKTKVSLEKQDFHMASSDEGFELGLRVLMNDRQGFASSNSIESRDIKQLVSRAIEIATLSPPNPNYSIEPSDNVSNDAPGDLWDESVFGLSLQTQKEWTRLMFDEALRDSRFRLNDGSLEKSCEVFLIKNSQGTHKYQKESSITWTLTGMSSDESTMTSFDYFQHMARRTQGTPESIMASTQQFRNQLASNLKQGPTKSYKGIVVFSPRAIADIFLKAVVYHLNGRNVAEKTSLWNKQTVGTEVFHPMITVHDMPWLSDRFGCCAFDREGVPTKNRTLIHQGKLEGFITDQYAAKALELKSSGNAVGGPSTPGSVGPHSLMLAPGEEALQSLFNRIAETQRECLVIHRYSGRVDPVTGDFSGVAKGGDWWVGGERVYSVTETLVSGNLFEAFGNSMFGISKELQLVDCSEQAPSVAVGGVSVTGGK